MITVCNKAPNFKAPAVLPDGTIVDDLELEKYRGQYVLLFFYPLDFTFVCPSEVLAHDKRVTEFEERNVQILGVSMDSQFTHAAWRNTPVSRGGIGPIKFPMVADLTKEIISSYGVQHPDGPALRASFLIDKEGTIQHISLNNLSVGRDVDEMLRVVDALQFTEEHGEVCPAGWKRGDSGMEASSEGVAKFLSHNASRL